MRVSYKYVPNQDLNDQSLIQIINNQEQSSLTHFPEFSSPRFDAFIQSEEAPFRYLNYRRPFLLKK